ncbi:aminopeptidase N, partial [Biomphalaria pfeifferi]
MQKLLRDAFQYYGMDNNGNSVALNTDALARATIANLACRNGIQECLDASKRLFKTWMDNPQNNLIEPDIKPTVYCYAIYAGGVHEWNFAFKMYEKTNETAEKNFLLGGLSCSVYPWILNRFMNLILLENSPIAVHDALQVLTLVSQNPSGRYPAWYFFREKFQQLTKKFGQHMFNWANAIDTITKFFNTNTELSE